MLICTCKATGKLIEAATHSTRETIVSNAVASGYAEAGIDVREATNVEVAALLSARRDVQILAQITALEAQQTPRRIREAALTDEGRAWLEALDAQIAALRAQL